MSKTRVAINIPVTPGDGSGGVQQFILGLVSGLGQLESDQVEYVLVTDPQNPGWLDQYAGRNIDIQPRPWSGVVERGRAMLPDRLKDPIETVARKTRNVVSEPSIPDAGGFFESLGADAVHFPTQQHPKTDLPSVYNPHDLQHIHLPEYFSNRQIRRRELQYRFGCDSADAVVVASNWVKSDIIENYGTNPRKIHVVTLSAPVSAYEREHTPEDVQSTFDIPDEYCLYPAQTWPHKNHLRLLEAIAELRDNRDVIVNLVCTGGKNDHWPTIQSRINELDLGDQVFFLGFVDEKYLPALYTESLFTVIPTLFEAASFPMYEAWYEGSPVACSNVTSLPDIAGEAALLFDPESIQSIAGAVERMATDSETRQRLKQRADKRLDELSWKKTARQYELLYRHVAGDVLSREEREVINTSIELDHS